MEFGFWSLEFKSLQEYKKSGNITKLNQNNTMEIIEIDAKNQSLGRTASKVASLLMGKNKPTFARNMVAPVKIHILNTSKIKVSPKMLVDKKYVSYTGYPGGLNIKSMAHKAATKGYSEIMKLAIYGMLPSNKLRPRIMKNLTISE